MCCYRAVFGPGDGLHGRFFHAQILIWSIQTPKPGGLAPPVARCLSVCVARQPSSGVASTPGIQPRATVRRANAAPALIRPGRTRQSAITPAKKSSNMFAHLGDPLLTALLFFSSTTRTACGGDAILQRRRQPTAEHALQSALGACLWQRQQEPLRFNAGQGSGETPPPGLAGEPFGCSPARSSVPRRRRACRLCGHIQVLSSRLQLRLAWFWS